MVSKPGIGWCVPASTLIPKECIVRSHGRRELSISYKGWKSLPNNQTFINGTRDRYWARALIPKGVNCGRCANENADPQRGELIGWIVGGVRARILIPKGVNCEISHRLQGYIGKQSIPYEGEL